MTFRWREKESHLIARRPSLYARSVSCGRRAVKRYLANVCMGTLSLWMTSPRPLKGPPGHMERDRVQHIRTALSIISDCRVESGLMDRRLVSQWGQAQQVRERNLSGAYRWGGRWEGKQAARPHGLWQSLSSLVAAQMSALRLHRVSVGGSDAGWPVLGKGVGDTAEASLQIFLQA